jgi:hypothetical protein
VGRAEAKFALETEDELAIAFPGQIISHKLRVRSRDELTVAMAALAEIRARGGRLDGLQLSRNLGGTLTHCLSVTGLSARDARMIADRLAEVNGVEDARVEHHLVRV